MSDIISKELLSEVLEVKITYLEKCSNFVVYRVGIYDREEEINIHEIKDKCILYFWDKLYEITPRVMGAEIICLKTGYQLHIIQREDIKDPKPFDPRFTFKACQWILDNKGE